MNSALTSKFKGTQVVISKNVTADYSFDDTVQTVNVDATAGSVTVTIPLVSQNAGRVLSVRKIDSSVNNVVVVTSGSDLIEGNPSMTLTTQYDVLTVDNDGTTWYQSGGAGGGGGGGGGGLAPGTAQNEVLYANASLEAAGDAAFMWDPATHRLAIGSGYTATQAVELGSAEALVTVGIRNTNVSGYAGIKFFDANNVEQLNIGVGNTGASPASLQGAYMYLKNGGLNIVNGSNVTLATLSQAGVLSVNNTIWSTSGGFKFPDGTTQTTAASAGGTLSGGTTNAIPYWTSSSAIGSTAASWDGSHFILKGSATEYAAAVRSSGTDNGGYLQSTQADELLVSGGAAYIGGAWTAKATAAGILGYSNGLMRFFTNSGLTVGNTYVPTLRMQLDNSGALTVNGTVKSSSGGFIFPDSTTQTTAASFASGGTGAVQFANGTAFSSDATKFFWDSTNHRLGVGTNAPISEFHLVESQSVASATRGLIIGQHSTDAASAQMNWRKSRGLIGSPSIVAASDYLGSANFYAYDGSSYLSLGGFGLRVQTGSSPATNNVPVDLYFYASNVDEQDAFTHNTVRMILRSDGTVGIGTQTPAQKLTVSGNIASTAALIAGGTTDNGTDKLQVTGKAYISSKLGVGLANAADPLDVYGTPTTDGAVSVVAMLANNTTAFGSSPKSAVEFNVQTDNSNTQTGIAAFGGGKENTTGGNTAGYAAVYTRANGGSMAEVARWASNGAMIVGGTTNPNSVKLRVTGLVESSSGGFMFPDGSIQTSANNTTGTASGSGTAPFLTYWTSTSNLDATGVAWVTPELQMRPQGAATGGGGSDSTVLKFQYAYWDGAASQLDSAGSIQGAWASNASGMGVLKFKDNTGLERFRINYTGTVLFGATGDNPSALNSGVQFDTDAWNNRSFVAAGQASLYGNGTLAARIPFVAMNVQDGMGAGVKTGIGFSVPYQNVGTQAVFSGIQGGKENNTDNNGKGFLSFHVSTAGTGAPVNVEAARFNGLAHLLVGTTSDSGHSSLIQVAGKIESTSGGFQFPDGSVQTTAAGSGGGSISGLTDGRVTLSSGSTTLTDVAAFTFDRTNNRLKVGTIAGTYPIDLATDEAAATLMALRASDTAAKVGIDFFDDSNSYVGGLGFGNSGTSAPFSPQDFYWDLFESNLNFISETTTIVASIAADGKITGAQFNLLADASDNIADDTTGNATWTLPAGKTLTLATGSAGTVDVKGTLKAGSGLANSLSFAGSASGAATISTVGSDVTLAILPSGTGNVLIGTSTDDTNALLQVNGKIESKTGGFMFPDGSTQITSAAASGVAGAVQFSNGSGGFSSDDSGIHYDSTNHRLGLGITSPNYRLDLGAALADVKAALFDNGTLYAGFGFQTDQLIAQLDATTSDFVFKGDPSTEVARITGSGKFLIGVSSSSAVVDVQVASTPIFQVYNSSADVRSVNAVTVIGSNTSYNSYPTLTVGSGAQAIALESKNGTRPTIELGDGTAGFEINMFNFRSLQDDGSNGLAFFTKTATTTAAKRLSITGNATTSDVIVQNANLLVNTTTDNGSGSVIQANGVIQSTTGGIKYPDGSVQTSAASGTVAGLTAGRIPYASSVSSLVDTASLYWDTTNLRLVVDAASSTLGPLLIQGFAFNDSTANGMAPGDAAIATFYNNATAYNAHPVSGLVFGGAFHSADLSPAYYGALVFAKENTTSGDAGSYVSLSTRPTGAVAGTFTQERVRINAAGNMLVGTSTDNSLGLLQVAGAITATALSQVSGTPTATGIVRSLMQVNDTTAFGSNPEVGYSVGFYDDSTPTRVVGGAITWGKENTTSGNSASFARLITRSNAGTLTEAMRITSGQKVLIGTTTDDGFALLQVNGTVESKTGGFRFPDGTTQITAASATASSGALGAVQYSDGSSGFSADDAHLHWNTSLHHLLIGTNTDSSSGALLQVAGVIESTTGGYRFPDGSVQTSSATTVTTRKTGEYVVLQTSDTDFYATKLPAPLLGGTISAAPAADSTQMMLKFLSAATNGDAVGISGPFNSTRAGYGPVFYTSVRTDAAITNQRHFVGLSSADLSAVATLAGLNTIPMMAFRFDSALGDTNWMAVTSDGTTASAIDTGVAFAANTTYTLKIDFSTAGTVKFTINGATTPQVSKTTNLPGAAVDQGIEVSCTTLTTTARAVYIERVKLDQN